MNNGMRVWYEDYTTIDWIHDHVKERVRLRALRRIKGFKGWLYNSFDAAQAWILLLLIGFVCGAIASFIDVSYIYLSDLRYGYCARDIWLNHSRCCPDSTPHKSPCTDWTSWPDHFSIPVTSPYSALFSQTSYVLIGAVFAFLSASLVYLAGAPLSKSPIRRASVTADTPPFPSMAREGSEARKCVYHAAGSGIPEVKTILSGFVIRGFLGIKTLWVKTLALILSVASGLVVGQQGPLIHIACCAGNVLSRLFPKYARNDGKRREILSAAASAGVSVAFGAPIGGVLFSLEEVSYYFPLKTLWRSFFCALIAAITLKMFNPLGSGKLVLFQVSYDGDWHAFELVPFMVLGVLGGLYGHLFIAATTLWTRVRERTPIGRHPVWEVVGVAVLTGVFGYGNHYTRMGSSELVGILFGECKDEADLEGLCRPSIALTHLLLRTLLTKTLLTLLTFGLKIPGGIFIPSMAVGACAGRLMGLGVKAATEMYSDHWAFAACGRIEAGKECVIPGVYAMVGAVAALSGVTRMTVSLTIILFELTNSLLYVLPLMFTILVSKFTGDALSKNGLYDTVIERSGHPYLDAKRIFAGTGGEKRLEDVLEKPRAVVRCGRVYAVEEIEGMLAVMGHSRDGGFPVLEGDLLVGYVGCTELQHALDTTKTSPNPFSPITFRRAPPRWSLAECDPSVGCIVTPKPEGVGEGVHDFTPWMDQAPLSVPDTAPLDLVAELFVKLGVKMLCVVRDGRLVGVVNKKRLVAVLRGRDEGGL